MSRSEPAEGPDHFRRVYRNCLRRRATVIEVAADDVIAERVTGPVRRVPAAEEPPDVVVAGGGVELAARDGPERSLLRFGQRVIPWLRGCLRERFLGEV